MSLGSELLSYGLRLDPLSCVVPFLARLCCHVLFFHHLEVQILGFGALLSSVALGRALASSSFGLTARIRSHAHSVLAVVFVLLGISSRYVVLLMVCFVVGFFKPGGPGEAPVKENVNVHSGVEAKRSLVVSSFALVICGVLYRENSRFPALYSCLLAAALYCGIAVTAYRKRRRRPVTKFSQLSHQNAVDIESLGQQPSTVTPALSASTIRAEDVPMASVPESFVRMWGGAAVGHRKYVEALQWRQVNRIDELLARKSPFFFELLKHYPHGIHGVSVDGCVVLYELLGKVNLPELRKLGATAEDIANHMLLRNEYVFQRCFAAGTAGQIMTVVDIAGVRLADISADVLTFIRLSSETMDAYYPGRVKRLIICNAPYWFHSVWSMVSSILPDSVKKKIRIIGDAKGLDDVVLPAQRPAEYAGSGGPLGSDPMHRAFVALAEQWTNDVTPPAAQRQKPAVTEEDSQQPDSSSLATWMFGKSPSAGRQQAFLGDKNCFSYDPVAKRWTLDPALQEDDDSAMGQKKLTEAQQIEEHGLVLAIQAAHAHLLGFEDEEDADDSADRLRDEVGGDDEVVAALGLSVSGGAQSKVSAHVFLVCALLHLLGCLLYSGALVLPMWFILPVARGGLQKTTAECGLSFSAVAMSVFLLRSVFGARSAEAVRLSPVRAARLASAVVLSSSLLLPWLTPRGEMVLALTESLFFVASVGLIALLISAIDVYKRASAALFFISLSASFTTPSTIVYFVTGLSDVAGPFIFGMVTASIVRLGAKYPVDASFFLFLMGTSSVLLYVSTLLLNVQFRGDLGLLSDTAQLSRYGGRARRKVNSEHATVLGGLSDLLSVPIEDAQYMLNLRPGPRTPSRRDLKNI